MRTAAGQLVAEYSTQTSQTATVSYLTNDHLGTPRDTTDQNGNITARHDYHPFGEEILALGGRTSGLGYTADTVRQQFIAYERDIESDLDFAQARYYGHNFGRFQSPDRYSTRVLRSGGLSLLLFSVQPQNWNSYLYSRNNPIKYIDPDGQHPVVAILIAAAAGAVVGALVGGGIEYAKQKYWDGTDNVNLDKVYGAAAQGAIFGAVASVTGGAGLGLAAGYQALALAGANVVGGIANRSISDEPVIDAGSLLLDAGSGAGGGILGGIAPTRYANSVFVQDARYALIRSEAADQFLASSSIPTLAQPLTRPTVATAFQQQISNGAGSRLFESASRSAGKTGAQSLLNFVFNSELIVRPVQSGGKDKETNPKLTAGCTPLEGKEGKVVGELCGPTVVE